MFYFSDIITPEDGFVNPDRTYLGSVRSDEDMSAVPAFPHLDLALFKDLPHLYIFQEGTVTLFVMLLDSGYHTELFRKLREALLLRGLCKACIHIGPFVILTVCGLSKIFGGIAEPAELLEPHFCMLFFIIRCFQEKSCDLFKAFLFRFGRKIGVLVPCLRLSCKRGLQVFLRLCSGIFIVCHVFFLL